jgi:hypothetical protein
MRKNANDVTMYRIAMSLGSVVRRYFATPDPRRGLRAGYGVVMIGVGAGEVVDMADVLGSVIG